MRGLVAMVAAAALTLVPAPGSTAPTSRPQGPMVLLIEGVSPIASLVQEVVKTAAAVGQPVQASGLGLEDLQIAVGCADRSVACLQQIGQSIKASAILLVSAQGKATTLHAEVTMRVFDVATGADRARSRVLLPLDAVERQAVMNRAVSRLFAAPTGASEPAAPTGSLIVTTVQRLVELELDGQPRGTPPLELRNLPPGKYRLTARLDGHHRWSTTAVVMANRVTRVRIDLVPTARPTVSRGFLDSIRLPTWIVTGVGLVSLTTGAIFGAHLISQQNAFDASSGDTPADVRKMESLKDSGERDALVANVLFGVGSTALVAAAMMAYIDYQHGGGKQRLVPAPAPAAKAGAARVLIGPTGVRLRLSF